ncbi:ESPR-type extended signal peptide-containing protein, partial [Moraxella osloensis]|uniref:ESPR-type extended signal peptide-containing protein n=1 Tax=Faucicola osloensis TaxID=34062 RepID=UPI00249E09FB
MNHIYKVIRCKTTGLFIAVAETAKSNGKSKNQTVGQTRKKNGIQQYAILMNASSNLKVFGVRKLAFALSMIFGIGIINHAQAEDLYVDGTLTVVGNTTVNGTLTVGGQTVATQTELQKKANQTDLDATNANVTANTNAIATKADKTALDTTNATVATKANQSDLDTTNKNVTANTNAIATKADKTALDTTNATVATKANQSDLDTTNKNVTANTNAIATKADKTALDTTNNNVTNIQTSLNTLGVSSTLGGIKYFRVKSDQPDASATGTDSIAIGPNSVAKADNSVAVNGANVEQTATNAMSLGNQSTIGNGATNAISFGNRAKINDSATSAIALGDQATVGTNASGAIAIGQQATSQGGINAIAFGTSAVTNSSNSIAMGTGAQANPYNTISIGTGAGVNQVVTTTGTQSEQLNIGVNAGQNVNGQKNIAIGSNSGKNVVGQANIAIGNNAGNHLVTEYNSLGENVSIGNNANTYGSDQAIRFATAVGAITQAQQSATAIGYHAQALGNGSVALGRDAVANSDSSIAIGRSATATYDNVALGTNSIAATNTQGSGYLTGMASTNVVSVGSGNSTGIANRRIINVADGVADQDAATVAQLKKTKDAVVTQLTDQFNTIANNGNTTSEIKYDPVPKGNGTASITLKNSTTIGNVAAGSLDTDAVNVAQLNQVVNTNKAHFFSIDNNGVNSGKGNYNNDGATGLNSLAVGQDASANKERSIAFGNNVDSQQMGGIAIGTKYIYDPANNIDYKNTNAKTTTTKVNDNNGIDKYSMAIGAGANSQGSNSIAIGSLASTGYKDINSPNSVDRAIAVGYGAVSSNQSSTAIGDLAKTAGRQSISIGTNTETQGNNSGNIGYAGEFGANNHTVVNGTETYVLGNRNGKIKAQNTGVYGNDNVFSDTSPTGSTTTNLIVTGNRNQINQTADLDGQSVIGQRNITTDASNSQTYGNKNEVYAPDSSIQGNNNTLTNKSVDGHIVGNFNSVDGQGGLALGTRNKTNAIQAITIGTFNTATATNAIAIGSNNNATGNQSISIGTGNKVTGNNSGAIGDPTIITGSGTYTLGNNNGTVSGNEAGIFGNNNTLTGDSSRIIGNNNSVTGQNTFVMGNSVMATANNNVILGNNSSESSATTTYGVPTQVNNGTVNGITYGNFAGKATGIVSVGATGTERQIINVAPGQISATSTDAINGSQLYLTQQALGNVANSTKNVLGGNATVGSNGNLTMTNIGGTGKNTVDDAIKAASTEVNKGTNIVSVERTTGPNGQNIYTVNAKGSQVTAGKGVTVRPTDTGNNVTDYKVDVATDGITTTVNSANQVVAVTAPITSTGGIASTSNASRLATAGDIVNA